MQLIWTKRISSCNYVIMSPEQETRSTALRVCSFQKFCQDKKQQCPDFPKRPSNQLCLTCAILVSSFCSNLVSKYLQSLGHFVQLQCVGTQNQTEITPKIHSEKREKISSKGISRKFESQLVIQYVTWKSYFGATLQCLTYATIFS